MARFPSLRSCLPLAFVLRAATVAWSADDDVQTETNPRANGRVVLRHFIAEEVEQNPLEFESMIFGKDIAASKERIDHLMANAIEEACRGYDLPDQIRRRMELAAQSDKLRFFREIDDLRVKFNSDDGKQRRDVNFAALELRKKATKLFDRDSFFAKSRKGLLVEVPSINPEMTIDKLKRSRHRWNVERAIQVIDNKSKMTDEQRAKFFDLIFETTLPVEPFERDDLQLVKYRIGMLPREKLQPLFDKEQWVYASKILVRFQESGRSLVNQGVISGEMVPERGRDTGAQENVIGVFRKGRGVRVVGLAQPDNNRGAPIPDPALLITRHRANIDAAVRAVERQVRLRPEQHVALTKLMLTEIQPPQTFGNFDDLVVQYSFSQLSDDQLKPLFDEDQWPKVLQEFIRIDQFRPMLVTQGLIDQQSKRTLPALIDKAHTVSHAADAASPANRDQD